MGVGPSLNLLPSFGILILLLVALSSLNKRAFALSYLVFRGNRGRVDLGETGGRRYVEGEETADKM